MADGADLRSRRSSATVRALVLDAARELFAAQGYERVSTREIASRAGVTQALVFRHFGTKEGLFVEAVYQPFREFVAEYAERWARLGHGGDTPARDTEIFVAGLYRLLVDNRRLLVTLTSQIAEGKTELSVRAAGLLREIFDRLEREVSAEIEARGTRTMDAFYAVRFVFALVYGVAVLDDALFPPDTAQPGRPSIAGQMASFTLRGSLRPEG